ncbi:BppU family phage baseplate upper protein [Paenibacillus planticolens]|uniref:DUF2479 domain-containing protein n=1 Tax=Paenibacillus planticolens TaxID=2654976 RepID=A0ABX1ZI93_9BACL|nr:BppU family phage baseplate upper protein [Paenibacillus planticolens]NOU98473.1 DUF2479 domain-containing protein [Paenibacillus planticolens]
MASLNIKRHDTRTAIKATLKMPSGNAVDLTGATVKFTMTKYGRALANREADVLDAVNGTVAFIFLPEEVTETGTMKAEFEVTYPDGAIETFPNSGYIAITIEADLS